jgi:catechol 2,3-dioxygenase-like lactoylglutathione lyase family enzyme
MINASGFNHVALRITDPERSRNFYTNVLGLKIAPFPKMDPEQARSMRTRLIAAAGTPGPTGGLWVEAPDGNQIHLISAVGGEGAINPFGPHLALDVEDFDATKRELNAMNIRLLESPVDLAGRQLWILDPDGNTIELRTD